MKTLERPIRVLLFGGFQLASGNADLSDTPRFSTKKALLLFAYLLLHSGKEHSREVLAARFWPQSDSETGRRSLRDALRFLRQSLNEAGIPSTALRADRNTVQMAADHFTTDVADFEALLRRARQENSTQERAALLQEAIGLYQGPFLAGYFDIDDAEEWIEPRRRHYAELFENSLIALSRLLAAAGETERALEFARRAEELAPTDPDLSAWVRQLRERSRLAIRLPDSEPTERTVDPTVAAPPTGALPALPSDLWQHEPPVVAPPKRSPLHHFIIPIYAAMTLALFTVLAAAIHRPSASASLGDEVNFTETNFFEAPDAQNIDTADYQRLFGVYCAALEDAHTPAQRGHLAKMLFIIGQSAHYRDKGRGSVTLMALEKAKDVFQELGLRSRVAEVQLSIADAVLLRGERDRAINNLAEASRTILTLSNPIEQADRLLHIAELQIDLGDYDGADANARKALDLCAAEKSRKERNAVAFACRCLGNTARDRGDYDRARDCLLRSAEKLDALGDRPTRAAVLGELGDLYLAQGYPDRALALYEQGLKTWITIHQRFWTARFKTRIGNAYYYLGRTIEASVLARENLTLLRESNGPTAKAHCFLLLGKAQRAHGNNLESQESLRNGLKIYRQIGNPRAIAETLEPLAAVLLGLDQRDEAIARLKEADALRKRARTPVAPIEQANVARLHQELGLL